jgi:hypothetical protein
MLFIKYDMGWLALPIPYSLVNLRISAIFDYHHYAVLDIQALQQFATSCQSQLPSTVSEALQRMLDMLVRH